MVFILFFFFILFPVYFDTNIEVKFDTNNCELLESGRTTIKGNLKNERFTSASISKPLDYKVCEISYTHSIFLGKNVKVLFSGNNALKLTSSFGNIEVQTPLDINRFTSADDFQPGNTTLGGYGKTIIDGLDAGESSSLSVTSLFKIFIRSKLILQSS